MNIFTQFNVLGLAVFLGGAAFAGETNAVLLRVAGTLQPAVASLVPAPTFEYPDNDANGGSLVIQYQTDAFSVPAGSMPLNPGAGTNFVQEIGPKTNGFVLEIEQLKQNLWRQGFSVVRHGPVPHLTAGPAAPANLQIK